MRTVLIKVFSAILVCVAIYGCGSGGGLAGTKYVATDGSETKIQFKSGSKAYFTKGEADPTLEVDYKVDGDKVTLDTHGQGNLVLTLGKDGTTITGLPSPLTSTLKKQVVPKSLVGTKYVSTNNALTIEFKSENKLTATAQDKTNEFEYAVEDGTIMLPSQNHQRQIPSFIFGEEGTFYDISSGQHMSFKKQ